MATIYNIIMGTNNDFTAIWADLNSSINVGKVYVASSSTFSIVDLKNKKLTDYYTTTFGGRANETLTQDDIKDINV